MVGCSKSMRVLLFLLAVSCTLLVHPPNGNAQVNSDHDELNKIDFLSEIANASPSEGRSGLCSSAPYSGGEMIGNSKTIRDFLGPRLKSISITWVAPVETREKFMLATQAISDALQKSPKNFYGYQPWANAVHPSFIGKLHYSSGKTGEIEMDYGYLCVQDADGKYWWTRFTDPSDLNLTSVSGTLRFKSGSGYVIETRGGEIYLQMAESKTLVRELESLTGKNVTAKGELKKVPPNVTMNIPRGASYLAYGFQIVAGAK